MMPLRNTTLVETTIYMDVVNLQSITNISNDYAQESDAPMKIGKVLPSPLGETHNS